MTLPPLPSDPLTNAPIVYALGWINLRREDVRGHNLQALIGDGTPKVSAGGGGWQAVARDGRVAGQWWNGRDAPTVTLPIVFDDADRPDGLTVDQRAQALEALWGVGLADAQEPPPLRFNSNGLVPLDATDPRAKTWFWTLSGCEEADGTIRDRDGHRTRATYNITLQRLVDDALVVSESAKRRAQAIRRGGKPTLGGKKYHVHKGDTLTSIAAKQYGDVDRWIEIADHNGLSRAARQHLPLNKELRLP